MTFLDRAVKKIVADVKVTVDGGGNHQSSNGQSASIADFFDKAHHPLYKDSSLFNHENFIVDEFLPVPPAKILDIGCGSGRTTHCLAQKGYEVIGIDLSRTQIEEARGKYPGLDFMVMDVLDMPFEDGEFAAAIFSHNGLDCIWPVSARQAALKEIYRVVSRGGRFYLSSHNIWGKTFPARGGARGWLLHLYDWWLRLLAQLFRLNTSIREGYWWYHDLDGWLLLFSSSPYTNIKHLEQTGWRLTAVLGREVGEPGGRPVIGDPHSLTYSRELRRLNLVEHHVQYVLEKA